MSASENMVNISFRASKEDKQAAEKVCKQLGLSMSTALNIFIKAVEENSGYHLILHLTLSTLQKIWPILRNKLRMCTTEQ